MAAAGEGVDLRADAAALAEIQGLNGEGSFEPVRGTVYLPIAQGWYSAWQGKSSGEDTSVEVPAKIDNTGLADPDQPLALRRGIVSQAMRARATVDAQRSPPACAGASTWWTSPACV
jgi:hypothetical protein